MSQKSLSSGSWVWRDTNGQAAVAFVGKGACDTTEGALEALGVHRKLAYLRQIHSGTVKLAVPGLSGEGDALWTAGADLALAVVTADCVPVLLAGRGRVAALHAGWRGIVAGVVGATVVHLKVPGAEIQAWVGPAIGPCCYEVGEDVAGQVAGVSASRVVLHKPGLREPLQRRAFLDLQEAVALQLSSLGITQVKTVAHCTRCSEQDLWSYRREGPGAGRNRSFIWLEEGTS